MLSFSFEARQTTDIDIVTVSIEWEQGLPSYPLVSGINCKNLISFCCKGPLWMLHVVICLRTLAYISICDPSFKNVQHKLIYWLAPTFFGVLLWRYHLECLCYHQGLVMSLPEGVLKLVIMIMVDVHVQQTVLLNWIKWDLIIILLIRQSFFANFLFCPFAKVFH